MTTSTAPRPRAPINGLCAHPMRPAWVDGGSVEEFLEAHCERFTTGRTGVSELFEAFDAWCAEKGRRPLQPIELGRRLIDLGFARGKYNGTMAWKGLRWLPRRRPAPR